MNIFLQWHAIFCRHIWIEILFPKPELEYFSRLVMATSVEMKIIGVDYQVAMI
jgi:hypothetical protein